MTNAVTLFFWLNNLDARNFCCLEFSEKGGLPKLEGGLFLKWGVGLNPSRNYKNTSVICTIIPKDFIPWYLNLLFLCMMVPYQMHY